METSNDSIVHAKSGGVREMISIALPMVISNGCETIMVFTDRVFLSRLGAEQMSASMGGGLFMFTAISFFFGLLGYSTAITAQYLGSGQKEKCPTVTFQALLTAVCAYPLLLAVSLPLGHYIFGISGLSEGQLKYQYEYYDILMYGSVLMLVRSALAGFFIGVGSSRVVMFASFTAMILNVAFSYVLIFGKLGFAPMGVAGAAYGTLAGGFCALLVLIYSYIRYAKCHDMNLKVSFRYDGVILKKLLKFGFPAGVEFFMGLTAFTAMIFMFHARGAETAAAVTITFNWDHVAYVPLMGLEIGVTSIFGRYMGAGRPDIAHKSMISGLKTGTIYSVVITFFFVFFPLMLTDVFRPDHYDPAFENSRALAVFMLRTASIYVIVEALIVVLAGSLRGAGDTYMAMWITVGVTWVLAGILYVCLHVINTSLEIAWLALVLMFLSIPVLLLLRYRSGKWREIKVVSGSH